MSTNQDAHVPAVTYLKQLRHIITLRFILLWLFLLASGVALMELSFEKADRLFWFYLMRETGKALFITALVSVTIKFYTSSELDIHQDAKFRFLKGSVGLKLTDLKKGVQELGDRTESLGSSLVAFKRAGVASVYQNRRKAAQDIKAVLEQDGVTSIKIMGISMNDFIRDEYGDYHEAWQKIEQHIKTHSCPN